MENVSPKSGRSACAGKPFSIVHKKLIFGTQSNIRNDHFFERNSAVLKGIPVIRNIMVVIVRVSEKHILFGKYEGGAYMLPGQEGICRIAHFENIFLNVVEAFALFVAQVRIYIPVAHHF